MNRVDQDYYNDTREVEWKKFDEETANLSLQVIGEQFSDIEKISSGVRFGEAYVFKMVSGVDSVYGLKSGESAAVLEYDKSDPRYDEEFVEKFTDTFSASKEDRREKLKENFDVLLR